MSKYLLKGFKYKGKSYSIMNVDFDKVIGLKFRPEGCKFEVMCLNVNLTPRQRQLEMHRLIRGEGVRL